MWLNKYRLPQRVGVLCVGAVLQEPFARHRLIVARHTKRLLDLIHWKAHINECINRVLHSIRLVVLLAIVTNNLQQSLHLLFYTLRERRRKKIDISKRCFLIPVTRHPNPDKIAQAIFFGFPHLISQVNTHNCFMFRIKYRISWRECLLAQLSVGGFGEIIDGVAGKLQTRVSLNRRFANVFDEPVEC